MHAEAKVLRALFLHAAWHAKAGHDAKGGTPIYMATHKKPLLLDKS